MNRRRRTRVIVSYYRDGSVYPRGGGRRRGGDAYWTAIAAQAATLRHVAGTDIEFVVHAGDDPHPRAAALLDHTHVEVQRTPFKHRPPEGFYRRYAGSLFVLDAMHAQASEAADDDVLMFVDPDIVWAGHPEPLVTASQYGGVAGYELVVPPDVPMCHVSRREQATIASEVLGLPEMRPPVHFGGEFYGMTGRVLREVLPPLERWWAASLARFRQGDQHFTVEEHLMNAVLWERGEQTDRVRAYLQRVRTLPRPRGTRHRVHPGLVAWHLPLEMDRGFPQLLRAFESGSPPPAGSDEWPRWIARHAGICPSPGRRLVEHVHQMKWRLRGARLTASIRYGL